INYLNYIKSLEVEVRTPYLDNGILDFMGQLPPAYHYGKQSYRKLMSKMFPEIFSEMATQSNLPNLDVALRMGNLRNLTYQVLLGSDGPQHLYFDIKATNQLLDTIFSESSHDASERALLEE